MTESRLEKDIARLEKDIARVLDVPPWLISERHRRPRFARLRWFLRRIWPL
jgi:hypothetical protein